LPLFDIKQTRLTFSELIFRYWPTQVGLSRLKKILSITEPSNNLVIKKLKGFPLKLKFNPVTYMGTFIYYRGLYEEGCIKKLRQLMKPGMTFIDIGANVGLYTIIAAHLVKETGSVIAFEPQTELIKLINENIELNKLNNITLISCALGEENGEAELFQVSSTNDGQATLRINRDEQTFGGVIKVPIHTLSSILIELKVENVDGIKIDTEGAELYVLNGFLPWLDSHTPPYFIFFECIEEHLLRFRHNTKMLFEFFWTLDYSIYCLYRGRWRRVKNPADHKSYNYSSDMLAIHNSRNL